MLEQKSIFVLTLKPIKLQRDDEICVGVNVAKAEKIDWMIYAEIKALLLKYNNVLSVVRMGNQQPSSEQEKVQRLCTTYPTIEGKDIVHSGYEI